ncbi:MAG: cytochrome oxidase small assembly protein [Burkholderiaceae bacterium]|nr:cytochrome oxidase small assembly protein [Burkholderiaceae bacterium]
MVASRKRNLRTALVLGSIALVFFLGIVARYWLLGQ